MASNYVFSPQNGVIIPDTADILETVQGEFQTALGQDLSLEPATPQGRLIDAETTARINTINFNTQVANCVINISKSCGNALDAWGANFNIPRNGATSSRVPVTMTGVPNTVIPANSEASDVNNIIWTLESEAIIGENGTTTGTFICSQTGAITLGIGQLTTIVASSTTGVDGWETVTNTAVATVGQTIESDASYVLRILNSIFSGSALFGNYASACYQVANVQDVYTYENPYGTALQLDNISIPAHSVYVCVNGGNSEEIAQALYSVKSAGCGWCGNTTVTITDTIYETLNTVTYQTPTSIPFAVSVDATNIESSNSNLETAIQDVVVNYFNNQYLSLGYQKVGIRATISAFTLASLLKSQISGIVINSLQVGLVTPAIHATATLIKASTTSGTIWASVDAATFQSQIGTNGTYNFVYNGTNWTYNSETVTLSTYGITATGTPVENDTILINFSTGNLSQSPIQIYASEIPTISTENITVTING